MLISPSVASATASADDSVGKLVIGGRSSEEESDVAVSKGLRLYSGRRLTHLPRLGTKSEFCTFVSVDKVETSGSFTSQNGSGPLGDDCDTYR